MALPCPTASRLGHTTIALRTLEFARMATTKRKHIKIAKQARVIVKAGKHSTGCTLMSH